MKDLTVTEDLDQVRWIFNGSKNPVGNSGETFRVAMLSEIEKLPLTDDMAKKFLQGVNNPTKAKLKKELIDQFDEIFELAD